MGTYRFGLVAAALVLTTVVAAAADSDANSRLRGRTGYARGL